MKHTKPPAPSPFPLAVAMAKADATKRATAESEYLQEEACAAKFGVSVFFLRKLRYQGRIPAAAINGRMILYPVAEVRAFFERATSNGAKGKCGAVHGKWAAKRAPRHHIPASQPFPAPLRPHDAGASEAPAA